MEKNEVTSTSPGPPRPVEHVAGNVCEVSRADLPLSCPMPGMTRWNSHPRVYLSIDKTGWSKCPYCSTEYQLVS